MKHILVAIMFFASQLTYAGELDNERSIMERSSLAQDLPGSVVVRTSLKDGSVEVLHVNQVLPADKSAAMKLAKAPFKAVSVDTQLAGTSGEIDSVSSTSSWFFLAALGIGLGAYAIGRASAAYASPPAYGYGPPAPYAAPAYYGYGRPAYQPYYGYAGNTFAYQPYYGYTSQAYRYSYYGNPYASAGFSARGFFDCNTGG